MPRVTDIRPCAASVYFLPVVNRVPLKFGHEVVTGVTCARVKVCVEDRQGRQAVGWGDASGIPAYTRKGYERIQQIPLNPDEIRFATEVSRGISLGEIAGNLGMTLDQAQGVLFRFLCLEIFDYWPASALRG